MADTELVIFGLPKDVTDERLKQVLSENNVKINDSELLTKYEAARSFAYKVRVTRKDAEKLHALRIWPERGGVRPYTMTYRKERNQGRNTEPEQKNQVISDDRNNLNRGQSQDIPMRMSNDGSAGRRNRTSMDTGHIQGNPVNLPGTGALQYRLNPISSNGVGGQSPSASPSMVIDSHMPYYPRAQARFPIIQDSRMTWNVSDRDGWSTAEIPKSNVWDHTNTDALLSPDTHANGRVWQVQFVDRIGTDRFSLHQS